MFYSISGAEQEHVDAAGGGENADVEGAAAGGAEGAQRAHGRRRGHMKPGPRRDRGHVTKRARPAFTRKFLCLKKRTGNLRRRVQTLREALVAAAGGEAATAHNVIGAALAALSVEEQRLATEQAKEKVRAEVAAESDWLKWGELGRKLAPKVLSRFGAAGELLVVDAAKECASQC